MAENTTNLTDYITTKINAVRYNPSAMMQLMLTELERLEGSDIVNINPANPVIAALEASVVTSTALHSEHARVLRGLYPLLAEENTELYNHMSDNDYGDIFSSYAKTYISFVLLLNDIKQNGIFVNTTSGGYYQMVIPKYTVVNVSNTSLLLLYPVIIREYTNGNIRISMDNSIEHPLEEPRDGVLNHTIVRENDNISWVHFKVPMVQLDVSSSEHTIVVNNKIDLNIAYKNKFYRALVYVSNDQGGWDRIYTTHSDIVYDKDVPTARLRLNGDNTFNITIPPIYLNSDTLSGILRVVVYTTNGAVNIDLADFNIESFSKKVRIIDVKDSDEFTAAFNASNIGIYGTMLLEGGHNGLSFKDLRKRIIKRTTGRIDAPVTLDEISAMAARDEYTIYRAAQNISDTDIVFTKTNSTLVGIDAIPTLAMYSATPEEMLSNPSVIKKNNIIMLPSGTVFSIDNDVVSMISSNKVAAIRSETISTQISEIDKLGGYYTPFYHMLDTNNDMFSQRVYHLDTPKINHISFVLSNPSTTVEVNTGTYEITKTEFGYSIDISTKSSVNYKDLGAETQYAQMIFKQGLRSFHINGIRNSRLTTDDEVVFKFDIMTDHIVDSDHRLVIKNMVDEAGIVDDVYLDLETDIYLYYITTSPNVPHEYSELDREISLSDIGSNGIAITKERYSIKYGTYLSHLYTKSSISYKEKVYKKYDIDIPAVYEKDVYQVNPKNGSFFFIDPDTCSVTKNILHHKGDKQRSPSGDIIFKHRVGDIILGQDGNPIVDMDKSVQLGISLVLLESEFLFSTAPEYSLLRQKLSDTLAHRSSVVVRDYDRRVLENTNGFYGAYKTHGVIKTSTGVVESRKPVSIDIYIRGGIRLDTDTTNLLKSSVTDIIVNMSYDKEIVVDAIRTLIREQLGDIIQNIQITGMGDADKTGVISVTNDAERYSLKKVTYITQDGYLGTTYDVSYSIYET